MSQVVLGYMVPIVRNNPQPNMQLRLNPEFSFSDISCPMKAKEPSLPYYLLMTGMKEAKHLCHSLGS